MTAPSGKFPASYWLAPACMVLGIANLFRASYFYFLQNSLSLGMFAVGGTLVVASLVAGYFAWDDYHGQQQKLQSRHEGEELSAEEYARRFEEDQQ